MNLGKSDRFAVRTVTGEFAVCSHTSHGRHPFGRTRWNHTCRSWPPDRWQPSWCLPLPNSLHHIAGACLLSTHSLELDVYVCWVWLKYCLKEFPPKGNFSPKQKMVLYSCLKWRGRTEERDTSAEMEKHLSRLDLFPAISAEPLALPVASCCCCQRFTLLNLSFHSTLNDTSQTASKIQLNFRQDKVQADPCFPNSITSINAPPVIRV